MIGLVGRPTGAELWQSLQIAGLVNGPQPPSQAPDSPWYVRLMLGFAGWIAACFLLGFIAAALAWVLEGRAAAVITGLLMMAAAWQILRRLSGNEFSTQFALAVSFTGQIVFAFGVFNRSGGFETDTAAWVFMALMQTALAVLMPNTIHRFCSAFLAASALYMVFRVAGLAFALPALILAAAAWAWLQEFRWPKHAHAIRPAAYGLVLATLSLTLAERWYGSMQFAAGVVPGGLSLHGPWLGALLLGSVLLWVVWALLQRGRVPTSSRFGVLCLLGTLALIGVSFKAPGITVGVTVVLLGHAQGNRVLTGLGIAALLTYIGSYYYQMDVTLLHKAQSLAVLGAVLLLLRWLLLRRTEPAAAPRLREQDRA